VSGSSRRAARSLLALGLGAALVLAACGGDDDAASTDPSSAGADAAPCPIGALDDVTGPVEITFWHQLQASNEEALQAQVERFHAAQDEVRVKLVYQGEDLLAAYRSALSTGALPDVLQIEETQLATMVDSGRTLPVQACVDAEGYALADFLPRTIAYYTLDGELRSMPWNVSNPVLLYSPAMFEAAGLDPDDPPETLAEVREYSRRIVDAQVAPHGIALRVRPFFNEFWFTKGGEPYVDNANGREARATKSNLATGVGREVWRWWDEMVESGLAIDTGPGVASADHLLAVGNGQAAMTFDGSSVIGPVLDVLASGQFPGAKIAVAPLPGVEPGGGMQTAEGSLYLVDGEREKVAAAWELTKFLVDTEQIVDLHLKTGYVPIRTSAVEDPRVQQRWREQPAFRVPYDQLVAGAEDDVTAGAVIGAFQGVRDAVQRGLEAMLAGEKTPDEAIEQAQQEADATIADYNTRVGG